jgi:folate-binding protein YgfZ
MTDVTRELTAAREGALIIAAPELATLEVTGKDRLSWLNGLVTQDVGKLRPGEGAYALCTAKNGKIQAELWLLVGEDRVWLGARSDRMDLLKEIFDKHLIMEDAELTDVSAERFWLVLHGPKSRELLDVARAHGAAAASIDLTGLGGAAIAAAASSAGAVASALVAAGATEGTLAGWDHLRVQRGVPQWGVDFDDDCYPQEASLEKLAVSFNKGCYLGQETVCMLELRGHVKSKLVRLVIDAPVAELAKDAELALPDGTAVGKLSSFIPGDATGQSLALGYVKYKHAVAGTELRVAGHAARIVPAA